MANPHSSLTNGACATEAANRGSQILSLATLGEKTPMTTHFLKLVSLGAAILGAACGDYSRAVAPNSTPRLAATASTLFSPARAKTVDERYAEVAAQASRFAGAVMAPDGAIELQVAGAGNATIDDETYEGFSRGLPWRDG